jgi:pimeloyl-ACP methyl ester carboxylesterase
METTINVPGRGPAPLTFDEYGAGRPFLLLHGGAGPISVAGFARLLAEAGHRVIAPTHPGFGGTPRPEWLASAAALAELYSALLDELDLTDVTVIGNSVGGWVAAELALLPTKRIAGVVLVDAVGIEVPGEPVMDVFDLPLSELADYSFHNPDAFRIDESTITDAQRAGFAANRRALAVYGGDMGDSTLRARLAEVTAPTLVIWGESDRVCTPAYGRAFAAAIPGARFELLPETGHVPQLETPAPLLALIQHFAADR